MGESIYKKNQFVKPNWKKISILSKILFHMYSLFPLFYPFFEFGIYLKINSLC